MSYCWPGCIAHLVVDLPMAGLPSDFATAPIPLPAHLSSTLDRRTWRIWRPGYYSPSLAGNAITVAIRITAAIVAVIARTRSLVAAFITVRGFRRRYHKTS